MDRLPRHLWMALQLRRCYWLYGGVITEVLSQEVTGDSHKSFAAGAHLPAQVGPNYNYCHYWPIATSTTWPTDSKPALPIKAAQWLGINHSPCLFYLWDDILGLPAGGVSRKIVSRLSLKRMEVWIVQNGWSVGRRLVIFGHGPQAHLHQVASTKYVHGRQLIY